MLIRDYVKPNQRLRKEGRKINRHIRRGLFEFLRYKKQHKINSRFMKNNKKHYGGGNKNKNMSILACQPEQAFYIGQDIQIVILGSSQGIVRLGIEAPPGVNLSRVELQARGEELVHGQE